MARSKKMKLTEFISLNSIHINVEEDSKKNLFKKISKIFVGNESIDTSLISEKLNERERLGSTSVGDGVAIPHAKIQSINQTKVIFLKLNKPIDFSSSDEKDVDIVFAIIAPENSESEHLLILSAISKFLKKKGALEKLRNLNSCNKIYEYFSKF